MPVARVERIIARTPLCKAEPHADGKYYCYAQGTNMRPEKFSTLDQVAAYLRENPKAGVRMNPGWTKISKNIYIDGIAR